MELLVYMMGRNAYSLATETFSPNFTFFVFLVKLGIAVHADFTIMTMKKISGEKKRSSGIWRKASNNTWSPFSSLKVVRIDQVVTTYLMTLKDLCQRNNQRKAYH